MAERSRINADDDETAAVLAALSMYFRRTPDDVVVGNVESRWVRAARLEAVSGMAGHEGVVKAWRRS